MIPPVPSQSISLSGRVEGTMAALLVLQLAAATTTKGLKMAAPRSLGGEAVAPALPVMRVATAFAFGAPFRARGHPHVHVIA